MNGGFVLEIFLELAFSQFSFPSQHEGEIRLYFGIVEPM